MRCPTAAVLLLLALLARGTSAEDDDLPQRLMPFAIRNTNAARYAVKEMRRLLASGRTARGLQRAQTILDELPDDYFRVASPPASTLWRLAAEEVRDVLSKLAPGERESYARLTRPSTRPMMERAVRRRDPVLLAEIVERFGSSAAGIEAARLLSDLALEAGRARDAAWWAKAGLRFAPRDAGLWLRHVDALAAAGDGAALASLAVPDDLALPLGDGTNTVAERLASWRDLLPAPPPPPEWPMWAGEATRSRLAPAVGPRPECLRWTVDIPLPRGLLDRDPLRGGLARQQSSFDATWRSFRPLHPVIRKRVVFVADGRSVQALDLHSGARLWSFDWESDRVLDLLQPGAPNRGRTSFERAFTPVLWKDLVLATVEVRRTYDIDDLEGIEISTYLPRRVLVALDASNGTLRWWMGAHAKDQEALEEVTVVSPCVVSKDLVVVVASRYEGSQHHVFFLAFDAATGRLAWQRSLGWGQQELNLFGAPVKELSASAPAVADGTVYASTGLGFAAAVDLRSGHPLWVASYEIQEIEAVEQWYVAPVRLPWVAPSPAVVQGDLLLLAPTDGRHLNAFDRRNGHLRWRARYPRSRQLGTPAQFLGTAHDGKRGVALVTGADLEAYDLDDGRVVWVGRLQDEYGEQNLPVGRGAVTADHVIVPTTNGLVRFSLEREGSFEGRDPWPRGVVSGNILPFERVLLVAGRENLQAFYSWDEIEHDVARRRQARPNDPTVMLEAGEIYRMGGALDRAERAFSEALDVAVHTGDAEAERRATAGLYRTCLSAATVSAGDHPEQAKAALERALRWARIPAEAVEVHVRLDTLLTECPEERARNLERLAETGKGVRARFPGDDTTVPARAMALLRLARVQIDAGHPAEAIEALQQLLREEGDTVIRGVPARDHARQLIDEVTRVWGAESYRPHEEAAHRLLERALEDDGNDDGDGDLLDRILREYPNASVVPRTLLERGRRHLDKGRAAEAALVLRRLLGEYPEGPEAPETAVLLARAYGRAGLSGARRFALHWLEVRHPGASFEIDGMPFTGRSYVDAKRGPERLELPPSPLALALPLREVHLEMVAQTSGREIEVRTRTGDPSPVALLATGSTLVAFDLVKAKVAFQLETGPYHRALYTNGILVLGAGGTLRGVTADTGQTLWDVELGGTLRNLDGTEGQAYALVRDTRSRRNRARVIALDTTRGHVIWTLDMDDDSSTSELLVHGPDLLLHELRRLRRRSSDLWPSMVVVDGLTGRVRHVIGLPAEGRTEIGPIAVGEHLVVAARDANQARYLAGHALDTGELAWSRSLPGRGRTCALVPDGERQVVVLQENGFLGTYGAPNGTPLERTRIFPGDDADARPIYGTSLLLGDEYVFLMPRTSAPPWHVGAWSRRTGKILWDTPLVEQHRPSFSSLVETDDGLLVLVAYSSRGAPGGERPPARVLLHVLDRDTGTVLQEIEPMGLAPEYGLVSMAHGWGTVVVFGRAGVAMYAAAR